MDEQLQIERMTGEGCPQDPDAPRPTTGWEQAFHANRNRVHTEEDRLRERVAELEAKNLELANLLLSSIRSMREAWREVGRANKQLLRQAETIEAMTAAAERRIVTEDDGQPE